MTVDKKVFRVKEDAYIEQRSYSYTYDVPDKELSDPEAFVEKDCCALHCMVQELEDLAYQRNMEILPFPNPASGGRARQFEILGWPLLRVSAYISKNQPGRTEGCLRVTWKALERLGVVQ